jgi:glycosyltransferase involved in cell wall biosynthesis
MKILFCPCHQIIDEVSEGGERGWAFSIGNSVSSLYPLSLVVVGSKNIILEKKYRIVELEPKKKQIDVTAWHALAFHFWSFIKALQILKNEDFDVIHHVLPFGIFTTFSFLFLLLPKRGRRYVVGPVQSALSVQDSDTDGNNIRSFKKVSNKFKLEDVIKKIISPVLHFLSRKTLQKADVVIVINEYTKKLLVADGIQEKKIIVIAPGIYVKRPFKKKKNKNNWIELVSVCYLVRRKRVDLIIQAMKKIIGKTRNVKLTIVGDGPEKKYLQNLVKQLYLDDYITFTGYIPHNKVGKYFSQADIFVNMSESESWGQVYLEAMSYGLPVISSKNIGSSAILEEGKTGYLVGQGDYGALEKKILYLIDKPSLILKLGMNAKENVVRKYDWNKVIIPKYIDLYRSITRNLI